MNPHSAGTVPASTGVDLHVERRGTGPTVVLLHGFTGDGTTMAGLARRLEVEAEVVVPDLVGHGRSCSPPSVGDYSVEAMAAQVAAVGETTGIGPFHLVGYSMGGRVALTLACRRPELLRSLTLIGASAGLAGHSERAARRQADEALAQSIERDGLERFVDDWMANPLFATQARLGEGFLAASRAQRLRCSASGLARSLRAAGAGAMAPLHDDLESCTVPTVFVSGAEDPKFTRIASEAASRMPRADAVVMANAGHAAHLEQPDAVAAVIRRQMGLG
ncbi:MAG: 2-succinyl-6-hydroxy-2,4-cyclohexadiene-1-carboxylate synthase [Acidimicrobiaceae bacterium]|nr:2-succinyl-6-hydroxy-2,4-cyclohexadiene-1-carboxylate synthase [Acidimicrobiaceae bacterium]